MLVLKKSSGKRVLYINPKRFETKCYNFLLQQEEFKMEIEAKMNKIKTKNVQREEKEIQLEAQLELNVRKWSIFYFNF